MEIVASGFDKAAAKIEGAAARATDARPAMREIVDVLEKGERAYWQRHGGVKWAPHPDGTPAGVKTGALRDSLTQASAPGAVREIRRDHLVFGTSLWYSRFMQDGTVVKGKEHAPKRPIIVYRPVDKKRTREILSKFIRGVR